MVHGVKEFRGVCRRLRERYRWSMEFRNSEKDTDGPWSSGVQGKIQMVHGVQEFRGVCRRFRERYRWSMEFRSSEVCEEVQ